MFENKTAVVTGAAKGIGLGIALELAKKGANVVIADVDTEAGEKASQEVGSLGVKSSFVKCDVSNKAEVDALISAAVQNFGGLDILVNNAGIYPMQSFFEMTESDWDRLMAINLKSIFLCSQAAAKVMKEGSKIVNISSIASLIGFENLTHYCASKGGINGFTRALALELAPRKINVNVVAPGIIITPGVTSGLGENAADQMAAGVPWKRAGLPADIAGAVAFLASNDADYITGQILVVDGGWTLK